MSPPFSKRKFPKKPPTITLTKPVTLKLLHDFSRYNSGKMLMRIVDTDLQFKKNDLEGSIGTAIGGTTYVIVGDRMRALNSEEFLNAVLDAEKSYLEKT